MAILLIMLVNPNITLAGVLAVIAAYGFARLIGMNQDFLSLGAYTYNPLLVGLSIGNLFTLTPATMALAAASGVLTFVLTVVMVNLFSTYLKLPVLSVPFVLVSTLVYLAAPHFTGLTANIGAGSLFSSIELPVWAAGYFQSLGAIFFMPQVVPGIVMAVGILATSRIIFLLSTAGYYAGVAFSAMLTGSLAEALANTNHFNSMLVAIAIGGIYLIPSLKNYALAVIAVCASTVVMHAVAAFWAYTDVPGFTLAFNVVTLGFVYVLGLIRYPRMAQLLKQTPEETLDAYLLDQHRRHGMDTTLLLPFSGKWTVWQGFDGQWTHKGLWRYAYDFVITDQQKRTYRNDGAALHDYYAFRKPVLSPVRGRVVNVIQHLPDNPVGQVDNVNNWGNLVIIQAEGGFFAELSHFAQNSIQVKEGAWVEYGSMLGLCGNSGYSPEPHIHIQVQEVATIGAYTVPFGFVSYANDGRLHAYELPPEGRVVEPLHWNAQAENLIAFQEGVEYDYNVLKDGKAVDNVHLTVGMTPETGWYLDSGRGKLFFGKHAGSLYFYGSSGDDEYLDLLLLALPRFPFACRKGLEWSEELPVGMATRGLIKAAGQFLTSFSHDSARVHVQMRCVRRNRVHGTIRSPWIGHDRETVIEWDERSGLLSVKVDAIELRREEYATANR